MNRTLSPPAFGPSSLGDVQHLLLEDVSWDLNEKLLKEVGDREIRMTYDDGRLEIMSPLAEHEDPKTYIGRMIETLTLEMDMPVKEPGLNNISPEGQGKRFGA